jgi:hypothetical protein
LPLDGIFPPTHISLHRMKYFFLLFTAVFILFSACSVAEPKTSANAESRIAVNSAPANAEPKGATIDIEQGGPADTVRVFYRLLREKKFREAIFLTNLRPAIEGLTDAELKEFSVDFESIAGQVPAVIEINGEIISGDEATVTANFPTAEGDKTELQTIKLKKESNIWVIKTADDESAQKIKAEGKSYFFNLRIETHEEEAKKMLERISKAELAHSLQNGGIYTDMSTLVTSSLLPADVKSSDSTGYKYSIELSSDKRKYYATATPAEYKKSGVRSFILTLDGGLTSRVNGKDNGGKPMRP